MQNNNETGAFSYTYSAKEQEEIKKIRAKYAPQPESFDKMEHLRRLDAGVTNTAQAVALVFGVIGTLLLGLGMSLCMTELGDVFRSHTAALAVGILIGIAGGVLASLAYPIYNAVIKAKRKKLAPQILRLTEELMK